MKLKQQPDEKKKNFHAENVVLMWFFLSFKSNKHSDKLVAFFDKACFHLLNLKLLINALMLKR